MGYIHGGGPLSVRVSVQGAAVISTISSLLVTGMVYPVSELGLISGKVLFPVADSEGAQAYVWFLRQKQGSDAWEIMMRPES